MVLAAIAAVIYAVFAAVSVAASAIYQTVRPLLLVAPHLTTLLAGLILVGVVNVVVEYSPDEARKVLSSTDDSLSFYARAIGTIVLLDAFLVAFDAGFFDSVGNGMHPLLGLVWAVGVLYLTYKYLQVLFQVHRLVRRAPYGLLYSTAVLLPITTGTVITLFDVPTLYPDHGAVSFVFQITVPVVLGALLVKYRVEPHVPGSWETDTGTDSRSTDDAGDEQDARSAYECLDCSLIIESESHPKTCEKCGGIVKTSS